MNLMFFLAIMLGTALCTLLLPKLRDILQIRQTDAMRIQDALDVMTLGVILVLLGGAGGWGDTSMLTLSYIGGAIGLTGGILIAYFGLTTVRPSDRSS